MNHEPWCVRDHAMGQCSEKRGKWDRSTNTWQSDLTDEDRRVIAEALKKWREQGEDYARVLEWVQSWPTFANVQGTVLNTWWMTQKRMEGMGRSWPILTTQ